MPSKSRDPKDRVHQRSRGKFQYFFIPSVFHRTRFGLLRMPLTIFLHRRRGGAVLHCCTAAPLSTERRFVFTRRFLFENIYLFCDLCNWIFGRTSAVAAPFQLPLSRDAVRSPSFLCSGSLREPLPRPLRVRRAVHFHHWHHR